MMPNNFDCHLVVFLGKQVPPRICTRTEMPGFLIGQGDALSPRDSSQEHDVARNRVTSLGEKGRIPWLTRDSNMVRQQTLKN